ncbi:sugar-binding transcriptional regulator [Phytoactinopolyspora endophytica]|uniref:sugar-binding transcriptional regulator n=1 Tax=Phytoactinopolyspora endophytica TaxID=1642495 RepID=UPI00101C617F|nr:sugar-binding domain-containing protein [Phytoactinopolyspora endophytica]
MTIARLYYLDDRSKVSIANELGLSRFQVARLLQLARESGMVQIEIGSPGRIDRELSAILQDALGVPRVMVVSASPNAPMKDIGRALAEVVAEIVQPGNIVGLTWSRALRAMVDQLSGVQPCTFIQLAGHVTPPGENVGSVELVRRAAQSNQGKAFPIYAPLLVPDSAAASSLLRQPDIATAMEYFAKLDVAVVSMGAWAPSTSTIYDSLTEPERRRARELGVIGEISGRLFDADGRMVPQVIDDRVIGISLDELKRVPEVVCSSYGAYRLEATRTAIRAGLISTLVVDQSLAHALADAA